MMKYIYRFVPKYAVKAIILMMLTNFFVYNGARLINTLTDRRFFDLTSSLDSALPVIPEFILMYVLAFPFWLISYITVGRLGQTTCRRFMAANITGKLLCGVIFLLLPTTNIRPVIESEGLFGWGMNFLYSVDKADNLFPSIHCFECWLCFAGIRAEKRVPTWMKAASFIMVVLVCSSTIFTKQHVLVDVAGGILIAEVFWQLAPAITSKKAHDFVAQTKNLF